MLDNAVGTVFGCDSAASFSFSLIFPEQDASHLKPEDFTERYYLQSFFPDRDGCVNKFSTYARHMEKLIYFFSTATLKCEPTPKLLYITFNFKKSCQSSGLTWLPGSSGRLIWSQRASEPVTRRATVYFTMRTCDPVTTW